MLTVAGFPYWFNGLVPLAYSLDDTRLKTQVHSAAHTVLSRQQSDGWLGPETGGARTFWARYPLLLGLANLADANATWQAPIVAAMHGFSGLMHAMLSANYTGYRYHDGDALAEDDFQWGRVRYQDMLISLMWLYEKHPDGQEQVLLDNMHFLYNGSISFQAWYNDAAYVREDLYDVPASVSSDNYPYLHGVNVGQGLKEAAVARRVTHNESLVQTAADGLDWTMRYHGAASGTVLADEREDGLAPYYGSELCTAVETMYSLSYLYQALGDPVYADAAELATFNAMPAMLTGDWWAVSLDNGRASIQRSFGLTVFCVSINTWHSQTSHTPRTCPRRPSTTPTLGDRPLGSSQTTRAARSITPRVCRSSSWRRSSPLGPTASPTLFLRLQASRLH